MGSNINKVIKEYVNLFIMYCGIFFLNRAYFRKLLGMGYTRQLVNTKFVFILVSVED